MKLLNKSILVTLLMLCGLNLYSQTNHKAVIALDKIKIFYRGFDNSISIAVPGINNDKINVSISNGIITGNSGNYIVKVDTGRISIVEVTAEIAPGEFEVVGIDTFVIKNYPTPIVCIGNYCGFGYTYGCVGSSVNSDIFISKEELLKNNEITIMFDLPVNIQLNVISFSIVYEDYNETGKSYKEYKIAGNKFTEDVLFEISKLSIGSKIYFNEIKVSTPDGYTKTLGSVAITLIGNN